MNELLQSLDLHPVRIPLRHRFRRVDHREAVLIKGPAGWGEFSPFPDYPPQVTTRWLASALESACGRLPDAGRSEVLVNVTVPSVDPMTAKRLVIESGAATAKVKVGEPDQPEAFELERVTAVREALGRDGKIRIDVNGAWDVETAHQRIESLSHLGLEYVEQPVASIDEMVELRGRVDVALAADESVRLEADPLRVVEAGGADFLVLKVQPMGGVARVVDLAARAQIPVVISSALETSVGLYSGLLAASLVTPAGTACGLGTATLLSGDVTHQSLLPRNGKLRIRRPEPDVDMLERLRPEKGHEAEMLRKVRAAAEVLT